MWDVITAAIRTEVSDTETHYGNGSAIKYDCLTSIDVIIVGCFG